MLDLKQVNDTVCLIVYMEKPVNWRVSRNFMLHKKFMLMSRIDTILRLDFVRLQFVTGLAQHNLNVYFQFYESRVVFAEIISL